MLFFPIVPTSFLSSCFSQIVIKGSQGGNLIKICLPYRLLSSLKREADYFVHSYGPIPNTIYIYWINVGWMCCCCLITKSGLTLRTPQTAAHQAPLSMGLSRQEHWSGSPFPPPRDLPDPGSNPHLLWLLHWQVGSSPLSHWGSPKDGCGSLKPKVMLFPPPSVLMQGGFSKIRCFWQPYPKAPVFSDLFFLTHSWPFPPGTNPAPDTALPSMPCFLWFSALNSFVLTLHALKAVWRQMGGREKTDFIHCPSRLWEK